MPAAGELCLSSGGAPARRGTADVARAGSDETLHELDTADALAKLGALRRSLGLLETQLRRRSVHRSALETFRGEIDELAGLITGDRSYFIDKGHAVSIVPNGT